MTYSIVRDDYKDHIIIDHNAEGAFRLTAMVHDPYDTFNLGIEPFYKTTLFYGYNVDEAVDIYINNVLNELNYIFVEEDF